jgi:DNA-binding NtrC family response regulator
MMTAYGSVKTAVEAMKLGAVDYVTKPFDQEELKLVIQSALERKRLADENRYLKEELISRYRFDNIVGNCSRMQELYRIIQKAAASRATALILGESGTGKELVARALHYNSPRRNKPFIAICCGALPQELLESELFGHEKGAFTGAVAQKPGRFELADGGTLFLDEIGDLSLSLQVKLLRVLQEREFVRVGGTKTIKVDVRVIAATNKNLSEAVTAGTFRSDLYYRLQVIQIHLPPLRERQEDIPLLTEHFLIKYCKENEVGVNSVSSEAMELLMNYHWPGNVRELENAIEGAVVMVDDSGIITPDLLPATVRSAKQSLQPVAALQQGGSLDDVVEATEKRLLLEALAATNWNQTRCARNLGISFRSIRYKIKKYGIIPPGSAAVSDPAQWNSAH